MTAIFDELEKFEQNYPKVAEAIKLVKLCDPFLAEYNRAMEAIRPRWIYTTSNSSKGLSSYQLSLTE